MGKIISALTFIFLLVNPLLGQNPAFTHSGSGSKYFDGVDDIISSTAITGNKRISLGGLDTFTIEFWLNTQSTANNQACASQPDISQTYCEWQIYHVSAGQWVWNFQASVGGETGHVHKTKYVCPLGTWHHYAMTYDGTTSKFYVDAVLISTHANTGVVRTEASPFLKLGATQGEDARTKGSIAEFREWTICRSAQEIKTWYNRRIPGKCRGLIVNLHFDETGSVKDYSGNRIHCTNIIGTTNNRGAPILR